MKMSLRPVELGGYVSRQLNNAFPDGKEVSAGYINQHLEVTLGRVEYCFTQVNNKYFFDGSSVVFNHLHGDQYCMFLYYLSNTIFKNGGDPDVCSKIFLLNKMMHGLDAYYEVSLPDIFLVIHPMATVLGRGAYSDYFIVYQRCGIGSNHDVYPELGKYVTMHPGAAILGNCKVADNCKIAAGSLLLDANLKENTVYFGNPKNHSVKTDVKISNFWRNQHDI